MGLSRAAIRFLVREHRRRPFGPSLLTLGRQFVYADFQEILEICRQEGLQTSPLPPDVSPHTNIPEWKDSIRGRKASDIGFFHLLGIHSVQALDVSSFEGAEVVCDLNQPIGDQLVNGFDTVVDAGTLEHVFDIRTALMNVNRMLKPSGRILHIGPCNNYANHGFYQFGPTLYLDYYRVNHYRDIRVFVAEETSSAYEHSAWNLFEIQPHRQPVVMESRRRLLVIGHAEKQSDSTVDKIPVQSYYRTMWDAGDSDRESSAPAESPSAAQRIKYLVPLKIRHFVRTCWGRRHGKPWGSLGRGRLS